MTVDADNDDVKYDGEYELRASFFCHNSGQRVWINAEPVIPKSEKRIKFRSERCPQCGSNHWKGKSPGQKYE